MYTINITQPGIETCPRCPNSPLQYLATQPYCPNCHQAITTIQQQLKVVPKMYLSNAHLKPSSTQAKIKTYLNQFNTKYGGISDIEEIAFLYKQVLEIKLKKGPSSKNYRENAAVIIYAHFKDCHRQSIKNFCKTNQIDQKSFNKSYLTYQKLIKSKSAAKHTQKIIDSDDENFKQEEDLKMESTEESQLDRLNFKESGRNGLLSEEAQIGSSRELNRPQRSNASSQSPAKNQYFDRPQNQHTIQYLHLNNLHLTSQIKAFLNSVFDSFFHSLIYAEKKHLLIQELSEQILEVYQTLKLMFQSSGSSFYVALEGSISDQNFYKYLFYLVLRKISHGVSQVKYRKLIQEATGEAIKATLLKSVIKALDLKEETTSSFSGESLYFVENSGTTGSEFVKIEDKD